MQSQIQFEKGQFQLFLMKGYQVWFLPLKENPHPAGEIGVSIVPALFDDYGLTNDQYVFVDVVCVGHLSNRHDHVEMNQRVAAEYDESILQGVIVGVPSAPGVLTSPHQGRPACAA